jgi:hypothetical protein
MGQGERPPSGPDAPPTMARWVPWLLLSVALFSLFLGLEPLLTYAAWGSDTGEYYRLTLTLASTGHFWLSGYPGWGFGYPYFPGIFEIGAAVSQATGLDPLLSLEIAVPALGALGVLPLFLLFRRLYPSDTVAITGAAIAAVSFPRLFLISHAAPLTLGDLLCVGGLWAFVEQRNDARWMVVAVLVGSALIISHHLSSYFFFISALGILTLLELIVPGRWSARFPAREYAFLVAFVVGLFAYWGAFATPFLGIVAEGLPFLPPPTTFLHALETAGAGAFLGSLVVLVAALLVRLRRAHLSSRSRRLFRVRWPRPSSVLSHWLLITVALFGGLSLLLVVPLPTTSVTITPFILLWYTPFLLLVPLAAGSRRLSSFSDLGLVVLLWLGVLGLSALYGLVSSSPVILPERHPEYLVLPLSLAIAISLRHLVKGTGSPSPSRRGWVAVGLVGVLLGANAFIAYPPPSALVGFQEGFTPQDMALAEWAAASLPPGSALASDHRLSDLYFGLSGNPATWDTTPCLFLGSNSSCAFAELNSSLAPRGPGHLPRPLDAVAYDWTMLHVGVALNPAAPALTMSTAAQERLQGSEFVLLYEDGGGQAVYWYTGVS